MGTEKKTRDELRKRGVESFAEEGKKGFQDNLAEAADQIGSQTGRKERAESFIEDATRVVAGSEEQQRKMRRPDIYGPKEPRRRRSFLVPKLPKGMGPKK